MIPIQGYACHWGFLAPVGTGPLTVADQQRRLSPGPEGRGCGEWAVLASREGTRASLGPGGEVGEVASHLPPL